MLFIGSMFYSWIILNVKVPYPTCLILPWPRSTLRTRAAIWPPTTVTPVAGVRTIAPAAIGSIATGTTGLSGTATWQILEGKVHLAASGW